MASKVSGTDCIAVQLSEKDHPQVWRRQTQALAEVQGAKRIGEAVVEQWRPK